MGAILHLPLTTQPDLYPSDPAVVPRSASIPPDVGADVEACAHILLAHDGGRLAGGQAMHTEAGSLSPADGEQR